MIKYRVAAAACVCALAAGIGCAAAITQAKTTDVPAGESESQEWGETLQAAGEEQPALEAKESESLPGEQDGAGLQLFLDSLGAGQLSLGVSSGTAAALGQGTGEEAKEAQTEEEAKEPEAESEYADLAIADVNGYVNVRTQPDTESEVVGKIYDGAVAQVLSTVEGEGGDWFQIVSGSVEGYIKAEFFLYGDAAAAVIDEYVTRYAVVLADRLNVRKEPDLQASRVGYLDNGERAKILEDGGDWLKVQYAGDAAGYVAAEYVTVSEEFVYGKTLEEEAKELEERRAMEERRRQSEAQAAENTAVTAAPPVTSYADISQLRQQIVDYALQFVGNKYIHGGQTLEGGTDCSGFTSLIYAAFGYSISRTPAGQLSGAGRGVDYSQAQPGDIICYGSGKCTHVALYIGDGQIVHSANSKKGVIIGQADYDTILGVRNVVN